MGTRSLLTASFLSLSILAGSAYLHFPWSGIPVDPPRRSTARAELPQNGSPRVERSMPESLSDRAGDRDAESTLTPSDSPPTPLYDEVRGPGAAEAYERLYSLAFDPRIAERHRHDLRLVARDAAIPEDLRRLAIWGLARAGDLEPVRSRLADDDAPGVQLTALEMLRRHPDEATFDLIDERARHAREPEVREAALRALAHLDASRLDATLADSLEDDAPAVRAAALDLLSRSGRDEALRLLMAYAPSEELDLVALARALSVRGKAPEAIERIDELARLRELSPEAARSVALSKLYAERPELAAVGCSGSH